MRRIYKWLLALTGALLAGAIVVDALLLSDLPDPRVISGTTSATIPKPSILINDRHGRLLYEVIDPAGSKHVPLPLDQIPLACQQATVATEDSNFYHHPGVDPIAIARAAWQNTRSGHTISGASTLTQQLARNLFLSAGERTEQSLRRKIREAWLAWRLEQRYSKNEILALYLNMTYYGHFAVGIEAAAQAYFSMHAAELNLAQCALLAGLPQYPAGYNPVENLEAAHQRQGTVLRLMVREGYITAEQARDAANERLALASTPFPIAAPHFVMWVQSQLETLLPAEQVRSGGLRVTTTLDLDWQRAAEDALRRRLAQLRPCAAAQDAVPGVTCDPAADPARRVENAALIALDPGSGAVLALVGSPDYFNPTISGAVNAAFSSRQPGSAIKPLTYAAALDPDRAAREGRQPWTAATLIADLRTAFQTAEGEPYVPNNYDRVYHGPVTVRAALANSYNIPAVKALDAIGVNALIEQANALGIPWQTAAAGGPLPAPSLEPATSGYGLALTLGGGEVRLVDLTAAYAAFANGGQRVAPYAIARVETLAGGTLFEARPEAGKRPAALDPRVAYLITDILSDNHARLPAFGPGNVLEIDRPAAVKTGTTTDWRDNWTVGYTPELVAGVWVGNADNTPMKDVSGISGAGPIWRDFMLSVLRHLPASPFQPPDGLTQVEICADSGLLPGAAARARADAATLVGQTPAPVACPLRRLEWFIAGSEPTEVDRAHLQAVIDARTGALAATGAPAHYLVPHVIWQLPPEYQPWARANGIPQFAADGHAPAAGSPLAAAGRPGPAADLRLTSPDHHRTYRIDPGLPRSAQQAPITALPAAGITGDIILLVDGAPFATASGPDYTAWWPLTAGQHTFQALARRAGGEEVRSQEIIVFVE